MNKRHFSIIGILLTPLALAAVGCTSGAPITGEAGDPTTDPWLAPDGDGGVGEDGPVDPRQPPGPTEPTESRRGAACEGGETFVYVLDEIDLGYATGSDESIVPGFDLDGLVSAGADAESCRQYDYTSPDGVPGIDNQLGPAIAQVPSIDVTGEIDRDIARGGLLLLVRLRHVDDLANDDCVDVDLLFAEMPAGMDAPLLGDTERFMPGQTFDLSPQTVFPDGSARVTFDGATLTAGHLEAESTAHVPFVIPTPDGERIELILTAPRVSATVDENGIYEGVLGGRLDTEDTIAALGSVADPALVTALVRGLADLDPDSAGRCQSVSAAVVYEGVPALAGGTAP